MMGGGAAHGGAVISSILKYLKYIHANKSIWCLDCEYYGRNRELFELFSYSESVTVINSDTAADQLDGYLIILGLLARARPGVDISTQMSPLAVAFLILSCLHSCHPCRSFATLFCPFNYLSTFILKA